MASRRIRCTQIPRVICVSTSAASVQSQEHATRRYRGALLDFSPLIPPWLHVVSSALRVGTDAGKLLRFVYDPRRGTRLVGSYKVCARPWSCSRGGIAVRSERGSHHGGRRASDSCTERASP